ncbi:MAG: hypothetical protein GKS03_01445 [Alphaproteobacteria bacterium]|nr:hypothetical protein [Alphaproteobacteria bacterium]
MDYLKRIPEICTVSEAADFLLFSFNNAEEIARVRRQECEAADDEACAAFWECVRLQVLEIEKKAADDQKPTPLT